MQQYGGVMHGGKAGRALSERPYIHDGKCYGFAGEWGKFGRLYCVSPSVSFADSSLIRGSLWGAVRIRRGVVQARKILPHTSSVKNQIDF